MNIIRKIFKDWIIPIISAIILTFIINKFIFFNASVPSGSMLLKPVCSVPRLPASGVIQ